MDPIEFGIGLSVMVGSVGVVGFLLMLGRAALRKADRDRPEGLPPAEDIRELHEAVGRLSAEIADLHERLDFAERVLASQRAPERLEGGQ